MHQKENQVEKEVVATNDETGKIHSTGNGCPEGEEPEAMAAKVTTKKAATKKAKKAVAKEAPKAPAVPKAPTAPKVTSTRSRIPNAASRRAMAQHKAGNLTRYDDADDLFRKLGIKVGKG